MNTAIRSLVLAAACLSSCFFVSCAGSMDSAALVSANASASYRTGQPVIAAVTGGAASSNVVALISNQEFKQALESSLVKSGMFKSVGGNGYQLEAFIASVDQPLVGISMSVTMNVSYTLKRGQAVIWRKSIKSNYTAPMGEALVGAVRVRKATEGATRENITSLIRALDEKRF